MNNDVSEAFSEWLEPITLKRTSKGAYIEGRWNEGSETNIPIKAVVQNASPKDLQALPEGNRTSEAIKLHSVSAMIPTSEKDGVNGDTFKYQDATWQIHSVFNRKIGNYYKAIAIRIKE